MGVAGWIRQICSQISTNLNILDANPKVIALRRGPMFQRMSVCHEQKPLSSLQNDGIVKNCIYSTLAHTSIFGLCFMSVYQMKSNCYSLIYSSLMKYNWYKPPPTVHARVAMKNFEDLSGMLCNGSIIQIRSKTLRSTKLLARK